MPNSDYSRASLRINYAIFPSQRNEFRLKSRIFIAKRSKLLNLGSFGRWSNSQIAKKFLKIIIVTLISKNLIVSLQTDFGMDFLLTFFFFLCGLLYRLKPDGCQTLDRSAFNLQLIFWIRIQVIRKRARPRIDLWFLQGRHSLLSCSSWPSQIDIHFEGKKWRHCFAPLHLDIFLFGVEVDWGWIRVVSCFSGSNRIHEIRARIIHVQVLFFSKNDFGLVGECLEQVVFRDDRGVVYGEG